jgi:hypothetical protein
MFLVVSTSNRYILYMLFQFLIEPGTILFLFQLMRFHFY